MTGRPKLGIAFGGGGIRGMAHIGLIEELDKRGIRADMVAGTSIGSCIGALYAAGYKGKFLASLMQNLNLKQILAISPSMTGLMDGKNYAEFVRIMTRGRNIEDLETPLYVVATDLEAGVAEVITEGPVWRAVQASSAIPGVFKPVEFDGRVFVDGCLVDNCPAAVLRQRGADIVVAVDLDNLRGELRVDINRRSMVSVLQRSVDVMGKRNNSAMLADVVLYPMAEYVSSLDIDKAGKVLEFGREEAAAHIDEIMELLTQYSLPLGNR